MALWSLGLLLFCLNTGVVVFSVRSAFLPGGFIPALCGWCATQGSGRVVERAVSVDACLKEGFCHLHRHRCATLDPTAGHATCVARDHSAQTAQRGGASPTQRSIFREICRLFRRRCVLLHRQGYELIFFVEGALYYRANAC